MRGIWLALLLTVAVAASAAAMGGKRGAQALRLSGEELRAMLGSSDLVVLDVRAEKDWESSGEKIAGAIREDPKAPQQWAARYPREKTIVLYCA